MECPYCSEELNWHDYYGKKKYADHYYIYPQSWIEKLEIFINVRMKNVNLVVLIIYFILMKEKNYMMDILVRR
jgi:hypothetical protein